MDIIKIEKKPIASIMEFNGTIDMDVTYHFTIERKQLSNGSIEYSCFLKGWNDGGELQPADEIPDAARYVITQTIINYAEKNGINN
mgnify:CR=1 FL=1|jgi:hypothetical protein